MADYEALYIFEKYTQKELEIKKLEKELKEHKEQKKNIKTSSYILYPKKKKKQN